MCFSDSFPFSLHRVQEFYTSYFNGFTYTEKRKQFGEIFKIIKVSFYACI